MGFDLGNALKSVGSKKDKNKDEPNNVEEALDGLKNIFGGSGKKKKKKREGEENAPGVVGAAAGAAAVGAAGAAVSAETTGDSGRSGGDPCAAVEDAKNAKTASYSSENVSAFLSGGGDSLSAGHPLGRVAAVNPGSNPGERFADEAAAGQARVRFINDTSSETQKEIVEKIAAQTNISKETVADKLNNGDKKGAKKSEESKQISAALVAYYAEADKKEAALNVEKCEQQKAKEVARQHPYDNLSADDKKKVDFLVAKKLAEANDATIWAVYDSLLHISGNRDRSLQNAAGQKSHDFNLIYQHQPSGKEQAEAEVHYKDYPNVVQILKGGSFSAGGKSAFQAQAIIEKKTKERDEWVAQERDRLAASGVDKRYERAQEAAKNSGDIDNRLSKHFQALEDQLHHPEKANQMTFSRYDGGRPTDRQLNDIAISTAKDCGWKQGKISGEYPAPAANCDENGNFKPSAAPASGKVGGAFGRIFK